MIKVLFMSSTYFVHYRAHIAYRVGDSYKKTRLLVFLMQMNQFADMIPLLPNKLPFFRQFHIIFGFIEKCQIYSICYFKMMSAETKWVTLTIHNRFVCCCFQLCNGQLRQRRLPRLTRKSKVFKTGLPKWIFDINKSLYKSK